MLCSYNCTLGVQHFSDLPDDVPEDSPVLNAIISINENDTFLA